MTATRIRLRVWLIAMLFLGFGALCGAARAQAENASQYIEFRDKLPASRAAAYKIRPWQDSEKATVLAYLNAVHEVAPGLLARSSDRGRVQLWRLADRPGAIDARAFLGENAIGFEEPFFRTATQERPSLKLGSATLSHELIHLADNNNRLAWSKEWSRMVLSRMRYIQDYSRNQHGRSIFEFSTWPDRKARQGLDEAARGQGMPDAYACANLQESLAECAGMLVSKQYSPPDEMGRFLHTNLLSGDARLSGAERLMNKANAARENKNYTELLRLCDEVIEQDAEFMQAYFLKAIALEMQRQRPAAIATLTRAIELFPGKYHQAFAYRGQLWAANGQSAKAIADFSVCVEEYGVYQANENVFFQRGKEWEKLREWGKAADDFEAALRAWPSNEDYRKIYATRLVQIQSLVDQFTKELSAPEPSMRLSAAKGLGKLGTAAAMALPGLESATNDSDEDVRLIARASLRRIVTALSSLRPGPLPGAGAIIGTSWTGTENLPGWGDITLQFLQGGEARMIDAKKTVNGTWWQAFDQVIITFQNCVYIGRIRGDVLSGNARFTDGAPKDWTWNVTRGADLPAQIAGTRWSGTETLGDYGTLTFQFQTDGVALMIDAKKIVRGTWSQSANRVMITFQNCVYEATVQGDAMSGNAYFTTDNRTWTFALTFIDRLPPSTDVQVSSVSNTVWSGTESLAGFGDLTFQFHGDGKAVMFDAQSTVNGDWTQSGDRVTITFSNCVYIGRIQGITLAGNARYTQGEPRDWTFSVTRRALTQQSMGESSAKPAPVFVVPAGLGVDKGMWILQQPPVPKPDRPDLAVSLLRKVANRAVRPLVDMEMVTYRLRKSRQKLQAERDRIVLRQNESGYSALAATYRHNRSTYAASRATLDLLLGALEPGRLITQENQALCVERWGQLLEWRQRRETIHDAEAVIVGATQLYDFGVPADVPDAPHVVRPPDRNLVDSTWRNDWSDTWAQWRFSANNDFYRSTNLAPAEKSAW